MLFILFLRRIQKFPLKKQFLFDFFFISIENFMGYLKQELSL